MTEAEKNEIVGLVMTEISSQAVDFDIATEEPKANDLLTAVRQTSPGAYVGVTIKWDDVARIATELANQAAKRAEQAETDANNILTQVQSKGTEITNFVATSKAEIETQKDESVNAVKSVYQTDLNELKGDLTAYDIVTLKDIPHGYGNWAANGSLNSADNTYTIRSTVGFWLDEGDSIALSSDTVGYRVIFSDSNGLNISDSGWSAFGTEFVAPHKGYAKVNMRKKSQTEIAQNEVEVLASVLMIKFSYYNKTGLRKIADIEREVNNNQNGITYFNSADFTNGSLSNGSYVATSINWRIATPNIISYPYKIKITADNGFSFGVHYFDSNDTFVSDSGWQTSITILPNQKFKIVMRYTSESGGAIGYVIGLIEMLIPHFKINTNIGVSAELASGISGELGNDVLGWDFLYSYYWQDNELIVSPSNNVASTKDKVFLPKGAIISVEPICRYKYYLFDMNGNITSHTNNWYSGVKNTLVIESDCYALICIQPVDTSTIIPFNTLIGYAHIYSNLCFDDVRKIRELEKRTALGVVYNYEMVGNQMDFRRTKYRASIIPYLKSTPVSSITGATSNQGMTICNGVVFQLFSNDKIELIDYDTGVSIGILNITSGHGDTLDFSDEYYDVNDEFPLVYITADTTPATVYVNRVTRSGCTLIRTYTFPLDKTGYYPGHCLDKLNKVIYQVGYTKESYETDPDGDNYMIVSAWDLKDCTDKGNDVYEPSFVSSFKLPFMKVTQGQAMFNGKLAIVSSSYSDTNTIIYFVDIGSERICSVLTDFPSTIKNAEIEGIAFVATEYDYYMVVKPNTTTYYKVEFA